MTTTGDDLTARVFGDMDPELLDLLKTKVNSIIKWDIIRFLHANPHTADTAANVARYVGLDVGAIDAELGELVGTGVLERQRVGDLVVYSFTSDSAMRGLIQRFVQAYLQNLDFRAKAIYHIIRGMR